MSVKSEPITINLGPQHPSTHGVFRMRVTFDGETIIDVEPIFGYLHRGSEKLAEERTYTQVVTLTDRMDYVSSMLNNQGYQVALIENWSQIRLCNDVQTMPKHYAKYISQPDHEDLIRNALNRIS